jgi:hypothetical protein
MFMMNLAWKDSFFWNGRAKHPDTCPGVRDADQTALVAFLKNLTEARGNS